MTQRPRDSRTDDQSVIMLGHEKELADEELAHGVEDEHVAAEVDDVEVSVV